MGGGKSLETRRFPVIPFPNIPPFSPNIPPIFFFQIIFPFLQTIPRYFK